MKKTGILLVLLLSFDLVSACTVCGCSSGMMGMSGQLAMGNFISFGMQSSFLKTIQPVDLENPLLDNRSFETLRTYTLSGQYKVSKHFIVNALLPIPVNEQHSDLAEYNTKNRGIGDMNFSVGGVWKFEKRKSMNLLLVRQGIIIPTGKDKGPFKQFTGVAPMLLTGRGAYGSESTVQYIASFGKWRTLALAKGQLWSQSKEGYQYGRAIGVKADAGRTFSIGKTPVTPYLTIQGYYSGKNQLNGESLQETGGYLIQTGTGIRLKFGDFLSDINVLAPVKQNQANNLINNRFNCSFNLVYQFNRRRVQNEKSKSQ